MLLFCLAVACLGAPAFASASTVWAVGDGAAAGPTDDAVGAMIGGQPLDAFLYLGDVYDNGTAAEFSSYYDPAYGAYKSESYPTPGNHEWGNRATGYDAYWGTQFSSPHYYSFDVGGWHLISLNSEESSAEGSPQLSWLRNDLALHPGSCTLAYWHRPRYAATSRIDSTFAIGDDGRTAKLFDALAGHASISLAGHAHNYQRLQPINGITPFVVGTGGEGDEHHTFETPADPRLAASNDTDFGALRLELTPGAADYSMVKLDGGTIDSGSIACQTRPTVSSAAASAVKPASAQLSGSVDPNGLSSSYRFEYGTTSAYGQQTAPAGAGAGVDPSDVSAQLSGLAPDTLYHYRLVSSNSAGSSQSADQTFMTPALTSAVTAGPSGRTSDATPDFSFSANEPSATLSCSISSGAASFGPCSGASSHRPSSALADGDYTFTVRATAGGRNADATRSFTVDATPPSLTIDSGPSGTTANRTPAFAFSAEPGASVVCSIDTGTPDFKPCTSPHSPASALPDGDYTFRVRATDAATNQTTKTRSFTVDATAPETAIDSGPSGLSNDPNPSLGFSASEAGAGFECRLDSSAPADWRPCSSPQRYTNLPDGPHSFEVRAVDSAANADPSPATRSFTVDATAPSLTIDSGPSGTTANRTPAFAFSAEPGASVVCSIDTGTPDFKPCTSPHSPASALPDGDYTFRVRATDAATNQTTKTRSFTVDATAPETAIDSGPSGLSNDPNPSLGFSASEAGAGFECRLDSSAPADWRPCSSPQRYTNLPDGPHSFEVRAVDSAANADPSPATRSFTVDATAPETRLRAKPKRKVRSDQRRVRVRLRFGGFDERSGEDEIRFECSLDGKTPKACESPFSARVKAGRHVFTVRAFDAAGNADPEPARTAWRVVPRRR